MELGELIKHKRKELGLTQKELSDGICTQALISRIEKGDIVPKKAILDKLGKRLNLEKNELNQVTTKTKYNDDVAQIKRTIRRYLAKRDYETIELLLSNNQFIIQRIDNENDEAFFSWIKASLQDKLYNKKDLALKTLNNISLKELDDELVIEILNAIGVIYYKSENFITNFYQICLGNTAPCASITAGSPVSRIAKDTISVTAITTKIACSIQYKRNFATDSFALKRVSPLDEVPAVTHLAALSERARLVTFSQQRRHRSSAYGYPEQAETMNMMVHTVKALIL